MKKDVNELQKKLTEYENKLEVLQKDIDNDTEPKAKKIDSLLNKLVKTKSSQSIQATQVQNKHDGHANSCLESPNRDLATTNSSRANLVLDGDLAKVQPPCVGFEHFYMTNFIDTPHFDNTMTILNDRYSIRIYL